MSAFLIHYRGPDLVGIQQIWPGLKNMIALPLQNPGMSV